LSLSISHALRGTKKNHIGYTVTGMAWETFWDISASYEAIFLLILTKFYLDDFILTLLAYYFFDITKFTITKN
jgi:hypothetical protein